MCSVSSVVCGNLSWPQSRGCGKKRRTWGSRGEKAGQVFGSVRTIRLGLKVYSSCSFHSPKGNILAFPTLCKVKYVFIALG